MTAEQPERLCRVTVDIDSYHYDFELKAIRAYYNAQAAGAVDVDVRISSSGRGIHIIAWFSEILTHHQKMRLREALGDDPNRVRMDEIRGNAGHTTEVLWTQKGGRENETGFSDIWHALETIETRIRGRYPESIPHGFQNKGRKAVGRLSFPLKTPDPTPEEQ